MVVGVGGSVVVVVVVDVVVVVGATVVVGELVVTGVGGSVSPPWQAAATSAMRSKSLKRCTRRGYKGLRSLGSVGDRWPPKRPTSPDRLPESRSVLRWAFQLRNPFFEFLNPLPQRLDLSDRRRPPG